MKEVILQVEEAVKKSMESIDESGHDWAHIQRVVKVARWIAEQEKADVEIATLIALLHDVDDHKFSTADEHENLTRTQAILNRVHLSENIKNHILSDIQGVSFKGAQVADRQLSPEGTAVRDADRLDAMGAVGIARAFSYGGYKQRPFYDDTHPEQHASFEAYKNSAGSTVNHFHEKLLLLKERIVTPSAKMMAEKRHQFMLDFLQRFEAEVEGKS